MRKLFNYLRPFLPFMSIGLSIKIAGTLAELIIPYILSYIIDNVIETESVPLIVWWGVGMIVCAALAYLCNMVANRMAAKVARDTTEKIRHDLFKKTMLLSRSQVYDFTVPSLESRLTSDTYNIHHVIGMIQRLGVRAPILLIGGIAVTFALDPVLTLVMIAILPFITVSVWLISHRGIPLYKKVQKSVDNMTGIVREDSQGIRVIKALSKVDYEKDRFDKSNKDLSRMEKKAGVTMALTNPLMNLFLNLGLVAVIFVGAYRVSGGSSDVGKIIAFTQYFTLISNAMLSITRIFVMISKGSASANRIFEVLDAPVELLPLSEEELPAFSDDPSNDEYIVFDHVDYSFSGDKNNLHDISFSIKKGSSLGIIGATGSGKTTIIQLLMRFYDVKGGAIRIGGRDVRTIPHEELYHRFGVVLQNDFLFADTVRENISFGRGLDDEKIRLAAERAQAKEFIDSLPDTYDYMLTAKGTNLSGGQKQRLLIARALADSPDILILDDSSSALDYKTDANLRRAIAGIGGDTTSIIVAQRISSIMSADLIIVLDKGRIIDMGDHEHLMENCEIYREISNSQMGGAFVD